MRRRLDLLCYGLLLAYLVAWYAPCVFHGRVWVAEDIIGEFYALRARLYGLGHGVPFTWWDDVPGLGAPRLADAQMSYFSLPSLFFYFLPTARVFSWYWLLVVFPLVAATFAFLRTRELAPLSALCGTVGVLTYGTLLSEVNHPPTFEALMWLPVSVWCIEKFYRTRRPAWSLAAGFCFALQLTAGYPLQAIYNLSVQVAYMAWRLWQERQTPHWRALLAGSLGPLLAGNLVGLTAMLPTLELASHSQRTLVAGGEFADSYRLAPWEALVGLCAELHLFFKMPTMTYAQAAYPLPPGLSVVVTGFALYALKRRPRPWGLWLTAVLLSLATLGDAGGVIWLLRHLVPFGSLLRSPSRITLILTFTLGWLAAEGVQEFLRPPGHFRQWVVMAAVAWMVGLSWWLNGSGRQFVDATFFDVPAAMREAPPRIAADLLNCPYFSVGAGTIDEVPTMVLVNPLVPRGWFEGVFASQIGTLHNSHKVELAVSNADMIPIIHPQRPLMRAFRLQSLIHYVNDHYVIQHFDVPPPVFICHSLRVAATPDERWALAASDDWNADADAIVSAMPAGFAAVGTGRSWVTLLRNTPDEQEFQTEGSGGLAVSSGLLFPGWSVTVDGQSALPCEADLALRSVLVPPGTHYVVWRYRPTWLSRAVACWIVAALTAVGCALMMRRERG